MKTVDTHAHIFSAKGPFVEGARYRPAEDASLEAYVGHLDEYGFAYGVLVQPSFFGYDNSQMLAGMAQHPGRIKGIAVVPLDVDAQTLESLTRQGIVGARLNLFGKPVPDLQAPAWREFLALLGAQAWQLELHCPPAYLRTLLPQLENYAGPVVIDHFGRIDPAKGTEDPDYQAVLCMLNPARHWVKVSGFYRLGDGDTGRRNAQEGLRLLIEHGMRERLVWGSDWPHTQHGDHVNYAATISFLDTLIPDDSLRTQILGENALALYGFAP